MARSGAFNKEITTTMHTTVTKNDGTRLIVEVRSEASVTIAWEVDDEWRETGACAACGRTYRADAVPSNEHRPICPNCGVDLNPSLT